MIKIEVTGNSLGEVADKLLAIGGSLLASDHQRIRAKGAYAEARFTEVELAEVAKAAPVDPTLNRPTPDASVTSPDTSSDTPRSVARKSAPAASVSEDEELEVVDLPIATLDFETVVRPLVLKVVEVRGKPVMEEMLSRFGVAKASLIEPALLPELVGLCNEALSK
jgi:hypothetical protein